MKVQDILITYFRSQLRLLSYYSKKRAGNKAFEIFCTPFLRVKYTEEQIKNATPLQFHFNNFTIKGFQWNQGASKKILIVHGFRSSLFKFQHYVPLLMGKGYEVMAFDAPAHGLSGGKMLTALDYKNFIQTINEKFGPFDSYLSHSFGGLAVSTYLAELNNNALIKNIMIAPAANSKTLIESFFKELHINDEAVKKFFYENIYQLSNQTIDWFSIKRCVPRLTGPTFWVHDYFDKITPVDDALQIAQQKPQNFQFLFTENLGHRRIYKDETVIDAVIQFL